MCLDVPVSEVVLAAAADDHYQQKFEEAIEKLKEIFPDNVGWCQAVEMKMAQAWQDKWTWHDIYDDDRPG